MSIKIAQYRAENQGLGNTEQKQELYKPESSVHQTGKASWRNLTFLNSALQLEDELSGWGVELLRVPQTPDTTWKRIEGCREVEKLWDFPGGPVVKASGSQCKGPGFYPSQGARFHVRQLKIPGAAAKTWHSQIKEF